MPKYHFRHPSLERIGDRSDLVEECKKDPSASYFNIIQYDGRFNLQEVSLNQFRYWEGDKDPTASTVLFEVSVFGGGSQKFILSQIRSPDQFNALHLVGEEGIDHLENRRTEQQHGIRADMTYLDPIVRSSFLRDVDRLSLDDSHRIEIVQNSLIEYVNKGMDSYLYTAANHLDPKFLQEDVKWVEKVGDLAKSEVNFASLTQHVSRNLGRTIPIFESSRTDRKIIHSEPGLNGILMMKIMYDETTKIIDSANEMISSSDVLKVCCDNFWYITRKKADGRLDEVIKGFEGRRSEMGSKASSGEELNIRDRIDVHVMNLAETTRFYLDTIPEKLRPPRPTEQDLKVMRNELDLSF